jgi:trigger factor
MPEQESLTEEQSTGPKNTVTVEQVGPCRKKVSIEVPEQTVKKAADAQYETLRKEMIVPGFRKGRAPRQLLEKRFGKEASEQITLKLLADASESAIKDSKLDILRDPKIDYENIKLPTEGSLKFDFEVEVRPEFELPSLDGIPVERKKLQITDEQLDAEIDRLRKWCGIWVPREGAKVELDDQLIADAAIKLEGTEEEQKLDNIEIFVRPNGFVGVVPVPKLDELLVGASAGDVKKTSVEVPKTFFREELRGKKVDVTITIKDVKFLKPADLNEDFFKKFAVKDINDLREGIRDRLQSGLVQQIRAEMTDQIYKYMLDNAGFDLPVDIVADQAEHNLRRQYVNLLQRGLPKERIDEQLEHLRAASEQQAKEMVKTFFIMDKVAEKLGIEVTDEEVNGHIAQIALRQNQRPERLKEQMQRDGTLSQLRLQVRENKCVSRLLESAKITEVEPPKEPKKAKKAAKKKTAEKATAGEEKPAKPKKAAKKKADPK